MNAQTGVINIRGKEYQTVALRVQLFRAANPEHSLITSVVERMQDCVVMKAEILDPAGRVIATGHAEEYRASSQINKTSALENAETSAIGRALAAFGIGGTEFATANEVENAIHQQAAVSGHSQQGEVSPEPPAKREPKHSALKTKLRGFVHELNGCGDADELSAFLATSDALELVSAVREKVPHWWDGQNWPESEPRPDEFEPLADRISRRQRECAEVTASYATV